jgi:CubicO group peptidase (beta-lactamase class C family)
MTKTTKRVLYGVSGFLGAVILGGALYFNSLLPIITGYAAKNLCSAVFVSGRNQADVEKTDLNFSFIKYTKNKVDFDEKSVTTRYLWRKAKAIYREGFGVTLLKDVREADLRKARFPLSIKPGYSRDTILWPLGDILPDSSTGINKAALNEITKKIISDNSYSGNAFAFMVLHKGIPVAEAYKPEFNSDTRFLSWSMAKSFTNALIGILVKDGKIDINAPADIDEWKGDDRSKITINDLMQMQSGLKWNEDYGNRSSVNVMLHCEGDMGKYAYEMPEAYPAGILWYYSSGTTNIVNRLIRNQFSNDSLYYSYVKTRLFNKLGMADAMFEVDASGTIVGSSYLYATARDYARFALLYENDGMINGDRILPEGWVEYTRTEAKASNGEYGSFFWLNKSLKLPSAPADMYSCVGHDGQRIFILPSQDLIVVVLGYSPTSKGGMDFDRLLGDILKTL